MNIEKLKQDIGNKLYDKKQIKKRIKNLSEKEDEIKKDIVAATQAREFLQDVATHTQNELKDFVEEITTTSIDHVYPNVYQVKIDFVPKRNKTECNIYYEKNGNVVDPIFGTGHGVADMCSFGLRIAYCALKDTAPILILDEPLRHIHPSSLRQRAVELIKDLAEKMDFQIIVVSNLKEFIEIADKNFIIENGNVEVQWIILHVLFFHLIDQNI